MIRMPSFPKAVSRHAFLANVVARVSSGMTLGEQIWSGTTGNGGVTGPFTDAVADTTLAEYATLVAIDDIAAAFATVCMLEAHEAFVQQIGEPTTPRHWRLIAHAGWQEFKAVAEKGECLGNPLGADMSEGWPMLRAIAEKSVDENKIRAISDLAGRMYSALKGRASKRVEHVPEEVVGVEAGQDFPSLIPIEYALAGAVPTQADFYKRYLARETIQYKRSGKERKARGPLVIALDESGSMGGDREIWSKAAMTALVRLAWEEKRPCVCVHFATATRCTRLNPGDYAALVKAQQTFLNGGTAIGTALSVSLDEVEELAKVGVKGADVVLVSDGGDGEGTIPKALDAMEKKGVRLWSVAIGCQFMGPLKQRASAYVHLDDADFRDPKSVNKLAGSVGL